MKNIAKAIQSASESIKGIEKNMVVGTGSFRYKGVSDHEVKNVVRKAMFDNGLVILPIKVQPTTTIERWEEVDKYSNTTPKETKQKQQVFSEVITTYLLLHESGESIEIQGYGHGVDAQDKAAGKATTYALKYALLYTFLIATGDIDDSDVVHSQEMETPVKPLKELTPEMPEWKSALSKGSTIVSLLPYFKISTSNQTKYNAQLL